MSNAEVEVATPNGREGYWTSLKKLLLVSSII